MNFKIVVSRFITQLFVYHSKNFMLPELVPSVVIPQVSIDGI